VLDPTDRVLLIRYDAEGYIFWATPGGAVEPGETDAEAAARELMEELHLRVDLHGPVHNTVSRFHHEGRYVENTDIFFAARTSLTTDMQCHAVSPFEAQAMQEARWWSVEELLNASEDVFPQNLAEIIGRLSLRRE
jgi:8-oxo-dGTP pyrophosphatase MutT (NUDIX family)